MNISIQIINGFINSELELFKKQFNETFVPEVQDKRSLAIAWLCYYFKDSISNENSKNIIQFVDEVYSMENYTTYGWFRITALQAAAFILTADTFYANSLVQNIGCGQSWARGFILESAAIVCPLLLFNNSYLRKSTEVNIKHSHGYYKESVILYLSTKGTETEKVNWLEEQISSTDKDYIKEFLMNIKNGKKFIETGFFLKAFNKPKSYFIFKMLSQPLLSKSAPGLFDDVKINFNELSNLEKNNPLNSYYFDFGYLTGKA